jgi:hypothetical protein
MKVLNLVLTVMFLLFAFVQINDPDPVVWILIYGSLAVTCVLAAFGYYYNKVLIAMIIILSAYSVVFFSGVREWLRSDDKAMLFDNIAKMQHLYIEESREFLGLMICILVLTLHLVRARVRPRTRLN